MRIFNFFSILVILITSISSCKKTSSEPIGPNSSQLKGVSLKNGVVNFDNVSSYNQIAENKNDEEISLLNSLKSEHFVSLRNKPIQASSNSFVSNGINQLTNNFDSSLYTPFLLTILNSNKVFSLDGFWIKIDMDNEFCSFIDSYTNPNGYQDLVNNNFANPEIHIFYDSDEPVLLALEKIRNREIDWSGYQTELARKNNNPGGICIKRGAESASVEKLYNNFGSYVPGGHIVVKMKYIKNFLSFCLRFETYMKKHYYPHDVVCDKSTSLRINYKYEFSAPCKAQIWSGDEWLSTQDMTCHKIEKVLYQAGSPLSSRKLIVLAYAKLGDYSSNIANYPASNFYYGNVPISIGY
jgi:hypothetical protein